jgi:hypothetical protein
MDLPRRRRRRRRGFRQTLSQQTRRVGEAEQVGVGSDDELGDKIFAGLLPMAGAPRRCWR